MNSTFDKRSAVNSCCTSWKLLHLYPSYSNHLLVTGLTLSGYFPHHFQMPHTILRAESVAEGPLQPPRGLSLRRTSTRNQSFYPQCICHGELRTGASHAATSFLRKWPPLKHIYSVCFSRCNCKSHTTRTEPCLSPLG